MTDLTDRLILAEPYVDRSGDVSALVWLIVGILALIALIIWILRNIR